MKKFMFFAQALGYAIPLCLIVAYFNLDVPMKVLLKSLMFYFIPSLLVGVILVLFQNWALKKGDIAKK
jgi:hypothetical protein